MLTENNNLFDYIGKVDAICITTNGIVKMNGRAVCGRGVALQARNRWSDFDKKLAQHILDYKNTPGIILVKKGTAIVSFPTKNHYKDKSSKTLIVNSAQELVKLANKCNWKSVVLPRPGCSNGGLQWNEVKHLIQDVLDDRFKVVNYEEKD